MKKLVTFFLALVMPIMLWAYDFQSGDLYYNITSDSTAMVTSKSASYPYNNGVTITSAVIPSSVSYSGKTFAVTAIDDYAFMNCTSLASLSIPLSMIDIGFDALKNTTLYNNSSQWENDVLYIGDCLIEAKTTISGSYVIKSNTRLIASKAFDKCSSLTSITIPENVQVIGRSCFHDCESLAKVVWNVKKCAEFYNSSSGGNYLFSNTPVTSFIFGEGVENVPGSLCYGLKILKSITIPASVTTIGAYAFNNCYMLNSVVFGKNVTTIGNSAFQNCSSLVSITIPNSVTDIGSSAFYKCSSLSSVTISNKLNNIRSTLFGGCSSLVSVTIPENVTNINSSAFLDCSSLTSITWNAKNYANFSSSSSNPFSEICSQITSFKFGNSVARIPDYLCYGMDKLQSITIPNSVTTIGKSAFSVCSSLSSVTIPENVTNISSSAFLDCSSLSSITWNAKNYANISSSSSNPFYEIRSQITSFKFGDSVACVPNYLCYGMNNLQSIIIPNSVITIGNSAFEGCSSLNSVALGNSLTTIGNSAFKGCSSFTSIALDDGVTTIGDYTFQDCTSLVSISIPENVTNIGRNAFSGCSSLTDVVWNAKNCEIVATGSPYASTTPFYGVRSQITLFTFGDSVANIPNWLCYGMDNLNSIIIPYNVASAGYGTFRKCSSLASVVWNAKITEDYQNKNYAPFPDSSISSFIFGDSVQHVPAFLCYNLSLLPTLTIPQNIKTIGKNAFGQCVGLTSIEWNPITCTGYWDAEYTYPIFTGCNNVESVVFGDNVQEIPKYLCYQMSKITSLALPKSLNTIGFRAFKECSSLSTITIPKSVNTIASDAFDACTSLNKTNYTGDVATWCNIKFANSTANPINYSHNFYINDQEIKDLVIPENTGEVKFGAFFNCTSLSSITILGGVTNIRKSAFNGCSSVSKIIFGESLMKIGDYAFKGCSSLSSLVLPASVESIGDSTFYNCTSISSITTHAENPFSLGNNAFYGVKKTIPIYVPCGSVEAYKSADGWNAFTNIQEPLPQFIISVSSQSNEMGEAKVDRNTYCEGAQISATAYDGYHFVQWSDGNTENPRTLTVTEDIELTAEWTPNTNTEYVVKHYRQALDGSFPFSLMEVENLTGTTATSVTPAVKSYIGFSSPIAKTVTIAADGSTVVVYEYTRKTYTLTWVTDGDALTGIYTKGSVLYGIPIIQPNTPTKVGYTFAGWNDAVPATMPAENQTFTALFTINTYSVILTADQNGTVSGGGTYNYGESVTITATPNAGYLFSQWSDGNTDNPRTLSVTEDMKLTAQWTPNTNIPYIVNHYRQALDGTYPSALMETENLTGTTATNVTPLVKTYTGFTSPVAKTATIAADGSTVVEYYYTRNQYTLTWVTDGNALTGAYSQGSVLFEAAITKPNTPTKTGYTFAGWDNSVPVTMPATDKTFTATWTPNTNTPYVVKHYRQALDGTYPSTLKETENLMGTTAANVTPVVKIYTGFTSPATKTETIAADGSTAVEYYYTRNKYTLTWSTDGDALTGAYSKGSVLFEAAITRPNTPTKTGYTFAGWDNTVPATMPAENLTLTALFTIHTYSVILTADQNGTVSGGGTYNYGESVTITATPNDGYTFSQWSDGNTDNPRTLTVTEDIELTAEFEEEGNYGSYSRTVRIGYNTICLPHGSSHFTGATFYEIAHILKNDKKIFFDEVKTLEAGKPYIFYPHSTEVTIYYDNTTSAVPLSHNGLHGTFDGITAASNFLKGKYLVAGNRMVLCGDGCSLAANRAYIVLDEISDKDHPAIPGIKRVSMDYSEENATTALDNITDESIVAPMQEGVYDILGRKVDAPTVSGFYIINGKKVFVMEK